MFSVSLIFKIAGCGIACLCLDDLLKSCGDNSIRELIKIVGVIMCILIIINHLKPYVLENNLFIYSLLN